MIIFIIINPVQGPIMSNLTYFDLPYELRHLIGVYTGQAYVSDKEQLSYVNHQNIISHFRQIVKNNNCHLLVMYIEHLSTLCYAQRVPILALMVELDNCHAFEIAYTALNILSNLVPGSASDLTMDLFLDFALDGSVDAKMFLYRCSQRSDFWNVISNNNTSSLAEQIFELIQSSM